MATDPEKWFCTTRSQLKHRRVYSTQPSLDRHPLHLWQAFSAAITRQLTHLLHLVALSYLAHSPKSLAALVLPSWTRALRILSLVEFALWSIFFQARYWALKRSTNSPESHPCPGGVLVGANFHSSSPSREWSKRGPSLLLLETLVLAVLSFLELYFRKEIFKVMLPLVQVFKEDWILGRFLGVTWCTF